MTTRTAGPSQGAGSSPSGGSEAAQAASVGAHMYETVLLEQKEPGIWLLTINRERAMNALAPQVLDDLAAAVRTVTADAGARCLLVTGAGRAFVAGADIAVMSAMSVLEARDFAAKGHRTLRALELAAFPVIALVNGYALGGGCELALACDFIVASDKAVFGQPEVNLGICPGFGGTQRLTRVVGRSMALDLVTTGRQLKADEALRIGMADQVVPHDQLMERVMELAHRLAKGPSITIELTKQAVYHAMGASLETHAEYEENLLNKVHDTEDLKEGRLAFREKRAPNFKGR